MRRSLQFAKWKAKRWRRYALIPDTDDALREGKQAYALKHAESYEALRNKWASKWYPLVNKAKKTIFGDEIVDLGASPSVAGKVVIDIEDSNNGYQEDTSIIDEEVSSHSFDWF
jgi:hypothetical protein